MNSTATTATTGIATTIASISKGIESGGGVVVPPVVVVVVELVSVLISVHVFASRL
jgi:hypothetical protein